LFRRDGTDTRKRRYRGDEEEHAMQSIKTHGYVWFALFLESCVVALSQTGRLGAWLLIGRGIPLLYTKQSRHKLVPQANRFIWSSKRERKYITEQCQ
jgi:hypothetical protein